MTTQSTDVRTTFSASDTTARTWLLPGAAWPGIAAGAVAGVGVAILMATLGAAIGLTAGAGADAATTEEARDVAAGAGIGAGVWLIVSAAIVGLVGGMVAAHWLRERPARPALVGLVTWALGVFLAALLIAPGAGGVAGGAAAGGGALAARHADSARGLAPAVPAAEGRRALDANPRSAEAEAAARDAAKAAAAAAWFLLIGHLVGLGATILMLARRRRDEHDADAATAVRAHA